MLWDRFISQQLISLASHWTYSGDKLLKSEAMTPETSAFLVPVRRRSVFKFVQHFRIRTLLPNICLAPSFSKLFGNFVVTVVLPGNNSQRFCGPFICLICMIGNSITASVNPKWKKVPVNNGVTIGQYNRKQVFPFCRKELLLLPHTHTEDRVLLTEPVSRTRSLTGFPLWSTTSWCTASRKWASLNSGTQAWLN